LGLFKGRLKLDEWKLRKIRQRENDNRSGGFTTTILRINPEAF